MSVYECVGPGDRVEPNVESEENGLNKTKANWLITQEKLKARSRSSLQLFTPDEDKSVRRNQNNLQQILTHKSRINITQEPFSFYEDVDCKIPKYKCYESLGSKEIAHVPIRKGYNDLSGSPFNNQLEKRTEIQCGKHMDSTVRSIPSLSFNNDDNNTLHASCTTYNDWEEPMPTRPFHELIQHTPPVSLSESDLCVEKTLTSYDNSLLSTTAQHGNNMPSRSIHKSLTHSTHQHQQQQQHQQKLQSISGSYAIQDIRLEKEERATDALNKVITRDQAFTVNEMKDMSAHSLQYCGEDTIVKLTEKTYNALKSSNIVHETKEEESIRNKLRSSACNASFADSALCNQSKAYVYATEETYRKRTLHDDRMHAHHGSSSESNLSVLLKHIESKAIPAGNIPEEQKVRKSRNKIRQTVSFNDGPRKPTWKSGRLDNQKLTEDVQAFSTGDWTSDWSYSTPSAAREVHSTSYHSMRNSNLSLTSFTDKKGEEVSEESQKETRKGEVLPASRTGGEATIQDGYGQIVSCGTIIKHYDHQEIGTLNNVKIVKKTRKKSRTLTNIIDTTAIKLAEHKQQRLYQTKIIREEISRIRNRSNAALVIMHGDGSTTAGMAILDILASDCEAIPLILQEPSQWTKVEMDKNYAILIKYEKQWDLYLDTIVTCTKARKVYALLLLPSIEVLENLDDTIRKAMGSVKHALVSYTETYECTVDERVNILRSKEGFVGLTDQDLKTIATTTPASVFFEYLKTYAGSPKTMENTVEFFKNPIPCLVEKIVKLSISTAGTNCKELYYVLSAVALSGGVCSFKQSFKCVSHLKRSIVASVIHSAISCSSTMSEPRFIDANVSQAMKKVQLSLGLVNPPSSNKMLDIAKLWGKEYCNVYDSCTCAFTGQSVHLAVCLTLMYIIPIEFLQTVNISFIKRFVQDETYQCKPFETVFRLSSAQYSVIARRFVKEILIGNVRDVLNHQLFNNKEFVDSFFVQIDRMGKRSMQVLTSREASKGNALIFYGADKDVTDIVLRICRNKEWLYCSSNSSFVRVVRGSSRTRCFVQEQNYKALLKVASYGNETAFRALTAIGTPATKQCVLNAISSGNTLLVKNVISQNSWDSSAMSTLLVHACKTCVESKIQDSVHVDSDNDLPDLVKCLLEGGCNPNEVSENNMFPVEIAVKDNNLRLLKLLIKAGAKVNVVDSKRHGKYFLHDAIESGNEEIVAVLLAQGLDPNVLDTQSNTPIHHAVSLQSSAIVRTLLMWKADPNMADKSKRYPLHIACQNTDEDVVNALIQGGADLQVRDRQSCTPIYVASTHVHIGIVKCLQDHGSKDKSCAFFAIEKNLKNLLEVLNVDVTAVNDCGKTLLEVSIENQFHEITGHLIKRGCDTSIKTSKGYSLLLYAIMQNNLSLFEELVSHGANVKSVDEEENTALHIACTVGNLYMAREILQKYPDLLHARTRKGWTPLHVSAYFGNDQIVQLLLDWNADRNSLTRFGEKPLDFTKQRRMHCEERRQLYQRYQIHMGSRESFERSKRLLSH